MRPFTVKFLVYCLLPLAVGALLTGMYFSGNIVLQRLVSPALPPLAPDSWREFGLLENLQNFLLLAITCVALAGVARKRLLLERTVLGMLACFTLFVLLEEVDYGVHWKNYFTSEEHFQWFQPAREWDDSLVQRIDLTSNPFNVHNVGKLNLVFKGAANIVVAVFFVILPLAARRMKHPWIRYAAPDPAILMTVAVMLVMRMIVHTLGDWESGLIEAAMAAGETAPRERGTISLNLSEFRELNVYYLGLVYLGNLVFLRGKGPATLPSDEPAP